MKNLVKDPAAYVVILMAIIMIGLVAGCVNEQDRKDRETASAQQKQYGKGQPVPKFDWSLERDLVIQLYRARNEEVATHTVWRSDYGLVEGDCASVGFGIPYDTSLTNPVKIYGTGGAVVEQAEPNGLFASKNSAATWAMCVVQEGDLVSTVPVYIESKVTVYPFPVTVDYEKHRVSRATGGVPSVTIKSR